MAHTTLSSLRSPSAGDEGHQLTEATSTGIAFTRRKPLSTSTPARPDISVEFRRALSKAMKNSTRARASKKNKAEGINAAALAAVQEKLSLPQVNEQVDKLTSSESTDNRDEIASKLADMLKDGDANLTAELDAYDLDLSEVIKQATESVGNSPEFSRYLRKASSETSGDAESPDRSRQASHKPSDRARPRSLSSSSKSDVFISKALESFSIDSRQSRELKAALAEKAELSRLYQQSQNTLAEKKGLEAAWEERKVAWAKAETRLEQYADGYKQDKEKWEKVYAEEKEKWENRYVEEKERWENRHVEEKEKWENRHDEEKERWENRYTQDKAEWQQQLQRHYTDAQKWETRYDSEVKKWEDRYDKEVQKREALEEELKTLKERLRESS